MLTEQKTELHMNSPRYTVAALHIKEELFFVSQVPAPPSNEPRQNWHQGYQTQGEESSCLSRNDEVSSSKPAQVVQDTPGGIRLRNVGDPSYSLRVGAALLKREASTVDLCMQKLPGEQRSGKTQGSARERTNLTGSSDSKRSDHVLLQNAMQRKCREE